MSVDRFFFLLFYAMRRGTVRWISIAYPDRHEDMPIYTRFNIRHSSYPGFRWRGLWRPFFFMEMTRLLILFLLCFADRPEKYRVVAFIILAERKGNILNKQTDGKWEHATYARGNDM